VLRAAVLLDTNQAYYETSKEANNDRIHLMEKEIQFELEEKAYGVLPYNIRLVRAQCKFCALT
jgi:hypothetical protein